MRIFYAAGNRLGSFYQLKRFINSVKHKNYEIKVSAFKKSLGDIDAEYMLDALLNFTNPNALISFNGNYIYYLNEIKRFNPDLIISDFEIYTSIIACELKIKLWQFSPINLYYALDDKTKQNLNIHKFYSHLIEADRKKAEYLSQVFNYSNRKFALSHLCDCENRPNLIKNYEWSRPSFVLGSNTNNFNYTIILANSNKNILNDFKDKNSILFSPFKYEIYNKMIVEDINNELEYKNSIDNCKFFISDGTASFLADAFYNQKYCFSIPRYNDIETIISSYMNEFYSIGKINYDDNLIKNVNITIDNNVKFISEYLEEL